ncbi:hypothetical protein PoB_002838400 [Plakobranchus ocellatus]|uniref:Uncharacterized protein n=1 Tax=Plakobranchus ocellatus TaxID=259542 RepID=A0AAV4A2M9_9GAST|nr:hypothetical protein PoB_002838400 [Plakobranchus ocellatus]
METTRRKEDLDVSAQANQNSSKTILEKNKQKHKILRMKCKDSQDKAKLSGWQMLSSSKRKGNGILMSFLREHLFHLLGTLSLIICTILFTFQAYLAFRSFQMMNQLHNKPQIPEMLYRLYFEGNDWATNLDRVDLRANTSIFVH